MQNHRNYDELNANRICFPLSHIIYVFRSCPQNYIFVPPNYLSSATAVITIDLLQGTLYYVSTLTSDFDIYIHTCIILNLDVVAVAVSIDISARCVIPVSAH